MVQQRKFIAGNWKMNGLKADLAQIAALAAAALPENVDVVVCPPFTILSAMAKEFADSSVDFGAQDCHTASNGAHTGDISAAMLKDAGAAYVIVGHSERRQNHGEKSTLVKAKAQAAQGASLIPIICVGETKAEREVGKHFDVVKSQLEESLPDFNSDRHPREGGDLNIKMDSGIRRNDPQFIIAYEPVWAIGTGLTPSNDDIAAMHQFIRKTISNEATILLYGGSVKGSNAAEILNLPNVNGALVGGASLKAKDFLEIISAAG